MLNPDSIRCCGTTSSHVTSGCQRDSCSGAVNVTRAVASG